MNQQFEQELQSSWQERQEYAEMMMPLIGKLYRNHSVEVSVYGRSLLGASVIDIVKAHRKVRLHEGIKLRLRESFPVLEALTAMPLAPAQIDIGKLAFDFHYGSAVDQTDLNAYLQEKLADADVYSETRKSELADLLRQESFFDFLLDDDCPALLLPPTQELVSLDAVTALQQEVPLPARRLDAQSNDQPSSL